MKRPRRQSSTRKPSNGQALRFRSTTRKMPLKPVRRSARLLQRQLLPIDSDIAHMPLSQKENIIDERAQPKTGRKRARDEEAQFASKKDDKETDRKRARLSFVGTKPPQKQAIQDAENRNFIQYWTQQGTWPQQLFEATSQTQRDLDRDSWAEEYLERSSMDHLLARKKSTPQLRRTLSQSSDTNPATATPSDQKPREVKSAPYQHARYETLLAAEGSFMGRSPLGVTASSKALCQQLLDRKQSPPHNSLFQDEIFDKTCEKIQAKNEARVIQDITRLIVPSAEALETYGDSHLEHLVESVNEGWSNSIAVTKTRPQPDYAVGFRRSAFTNQQLQKLEPFIGELTDTSFFMATYYMYFPFLSCEVKCGAAALDIADRQNAHTMTLAVRGVVELFRGLKREKELHREILAFSISHDHTSVRIYGHYALTDTQDTEFYRYPVYKFDFTTLDGKEKWTAYKFVRNIYDIWMPIHLKRICSAIDEIPAGVSFEVSHQSNFDFNEDPSQQLSQELDYSLSQQADDISASMLSGSQASLVDSQEVTPDTSISNRAQPVFKKPKHKRQG